LLNKRDLKNLIVKDNQVMLQSISIRLSDDISREMDQHVAPRITIHINIVTDIRKATLSLITLYPL